MGSEILKTVYSQTGQHFQRVGTFHMHIRHVVGLIEENRGLAPCTLFVSPVGVLAWDHRVDVRSGLRIPQECYWISGCLHHFFEVFVIHSILLLTVGAVYDRPLERCVAGM